MAYFVGLLGHLILVIASITLMINFALWLIR